MLKRYYFLLTVSAFLLSLSMPFTSSARTVPVTEKSNGDNDYSVGKITYQGKDYEVIRLEGKWWMRQGLRADTYRDGTKIIYAKTPARWVRANNNNEGAYCMYANDINHANINGYLYNWYAVFPDKNEDGEKDHELAPPGWHILTEGEWYMLANAGEWRDRPYWDLQMKDAGFYTGTRDPGGNYRDVGGSGAIWTEREIDISNASKILFSGKIHQPWSWYKGQGNIVRCVKDE